VFGERHAIYRFEAAVMQANGGASLEDLIDSYERIQRSGVKIPGVSKNVITERVKVLRAASPTDLPNALRKILELPLLAEPAAPAPVPAAAAPVTPEPAPVPAASNVTPIRPLTQGELMAQNTQRKQQVLLTEFLSNQASAFRDTLLKMRSDLRPAPMVKVVKFDNVSYLLTATARVTHDFGADHFGMWVDRFKPEEHPAVFTENCSPMTRSNRGPSGEDGPKEVIWVRVIEMTTDAVIRHWINLCARPGEPKMKRGDGDNYYTVVAPDGLITHIDKAQYTAKLES